MVTRTLFAAGSPFLQDVAAVFPDYTMSAKLTIQFRVSAAPTICQALVTVAIFVLFTIKHCFSCWMKATAIFVHHGDRSLLEKYLGVKDWAHCVRRMGHRVKDPDTLGSLRHAKTEPFCKTISANSSIIIPKQVNWKNHYPGYFMNCCRETAKMGVPPGNRRVVVPRRT